MVERRITSAGTPACRCKACDGPPGCFCCSGSYTQDADGTWTLFSLPDDPEAPPELIETQSNESSLLRPNGTWDADGLAAIGYGAYYRAVLGLANVPAWPDAYPNERRRWLEAAGAITRAAAEALALRVAYAAAGKEAP